MRPPTLVVLCHSYDVSGRNVCGNWLRCGGIDVRAMVVGGEALEAVFEQMSDQHDAAAWAPY